MDGWFNEPNLKHNGRRGIHAAEPCPDNQLKIVQVEEGPEERVSNVGPRGRRVRHFRGIFPSARSPGREGGEEGECACVCDGRLNDCFLSSVGASFSNIRAYACVCRAYACGLMHREACFAFCVQDLVDLACTVHLENEEKPQSQSHSPDPHNPESGLASPRTRSPLLC
jgi:hypothetical protein